MEAAQTGAIGKYRLIAELGQGGMAQVFLAVARGPAGFNKLVVIKQIREQLAEDPEFLTMFLDEARLAARLNHPNVVQTNEVGQEGRRYFIAMEYLEGQPLNRLVNRAGREGGLPMAIYVRILIEALTGLHYAHELGDFDGTPLQVVHRDMTPHNVFVTYSGQVKVVDFGIAKALGSSSETRTGVLKGKVAYMAPEQAMGEKVDRRADLFSVGVMLWEALTGRRLFKGVNDIVVLQKLVSGDIPAPRTANPALPERLEAICLKALAHDRDKRYATAAELASDLEQALDEIGEKAHVREAGKLVAKLFADEQVKIKGLVEAQIANIRASGEFPNVSGLGRALPIIDPTTTVEGSGGSGSGSISRKSVRDEPTVKEGAAAEHSQPSQPSHPSRPSAHSQPSQPSLPSNSSTMLTAANTSPVGIEAPPGRSKMLLPALALGVGAVAAFAFFLASKPKASDKPALAVTATATAAEPAPARMIRIESTPPGATIVENGKALGKTPIALALDPSQTAVRTFEVTLDGFVTYTLQQPPSREDVRIVVPLVAAAPTVTAKTTATATVEPASPPKPPRNVAPPPPPPPKPTAKPLDINMSR